MKVIEQIDSAISTILEKTFILSHSLSFSPKGPKVMPVTHSLRYVLESQSMDLVDASIKKESGDRVAIKLCENLTELLTNLSQYVSKYEQEAKNNYVSEFYKRKYVGPVQVLKGHGYFTGMDLSEAMKFFDSES